MPRGFGTMADEETGIILIVVGVVFIVLGIFFWPICGLGIVLLIIGVVLAATAPPRAAYAPPGYYGYGAPPTVPYPPQAPAAGMPVPGAPPGYALPTCHVCGSPLTWVPQYSRWYCTRCQSYR